ncbi:hypothetical protein FS749_014764 [Ceratobasidium sp. UAMH 11750]|nr:hypothetical protein FS749_014764 [Ceratobasidium sp. UAMH 11750]
MASLPLVGITALADRSPCSTCQAGQQDYSKTCARLSHKCAGHRSGPRCPARQSTLEVVSSKMSVREMFDCLLQHGCTDLSSQMDLSEQPSMAIAGGGFGDVYLGRLQDGTGVAIKAVRNHILAQATMSKARKRAMRELYVWSRVKHQNVQELIGIVMFQGRLGMVSPWMENGNLAEYVQRYPGVDRYELCTQVAKGVSYLHSIDLIHGDLKACNVLISSEGIAKLSDFDHSILSNCTLGFTETTNFGGGTLRWMAPELLLRQENDTTPLEKTKQSDVYALGMTMLETITGRIPYVEYRFDAAVIRALDRKQPPNRPEELSTRDTQGDWAWSLLRTCWEHDPAMRPLASLVHTLLEGFCSSQVTEDILFTLQKAEAWQEWPELPTLWV